MSHVDTCWRNVYHAQVHHQATVQDMTARHAVVELKRKIHEKRLRPHVFGCRCGCTVNPEEVDGTNISADRMTKKKCSQQASLEFFAFFSSCLIEGSQHVASWKIPSGTR